MSVADIEKKVNEMNRRVNERMSQVDELVASVENIQTSIQDSVQGAFANFVSNLPKYDDAEESKEGWVVLKEKLVEFAFEIVLVFTFFWPDWMTALTLSVLLGFKLFGAYLGKLFQQITKSKDKRLQDKDKTINVLKKSMDEQARQIYELKARLGTLDD